jgi:hypothetical protein
LERWNRNNYPSLATLPEARPSRAPRPTPECPLDSRRRTRDRRGMGGARAQVQFSTAFYSVRRGKRDPRWETFRICLNVAAPAVVTVTIAMNCVSTSVASAVHSTRARKASPSEDCWRDSRGLSRARSPRAIRGLDQRGRSSFRVADASSQGSRLMPEGQ